jgi:hypothetical protein
MKKEEERKKQQHLTCSISTALEVMDGPGCGVSLGFSFLFLGYDTMESTSICGHRL